MVIDYNDDYLICDCFGNMAIHSYIDNLKNCLTEYKKERKGILDEFWCNEYYDEIIFHEPSQFFHQLLLTSKPITNGVYKHDTDCE